MSNINRSREPQPVRFCSNCGERITKKGKFCVYCGHRLEEQRAEEAPPAPEVVRESAPLELADPTYKIMDPGDKFRDYTIVKLLNKDTTGIKYITQKGDREYLLKLYFTGSAATVNYLPNLKWLNNLESPHLTWVEEVNQGSTPPFMAASYVRGSSLAKIKKDNPERLTEALVLSIAKQLTKTAKTLHDKGFTIKDLTLSGIMLKDDGNIVILTSGINYADVDERQDVFTIGVILAQLISGNVLYATLYGPERLLEQKFTYIPGVSMAFNKVLSECLHRNILQRYNSLDALKHGLKSLPLEPKGPVYTPKPVKHVPADENALEVLNIKTRVEWWFWLLLGVILVLLVLLLSTNFLAVVSGKKEEPLHFTNIFAAEDSTEAEADEILLNRNRLNSADTLRGTRRTPGATHREDPRKKIGDRYSDYTPSSYTPVRRGSPIPANFVYVEGGTFGFNRLKENLNHNVSQVGFYISSVEVTQAEWNKYMMPASVNRIGDRYPVDNVSWMNIIRYCNRRSQEEGLEPCYRISGSTADKVSCDFSANGYRLPTEAEWEFAAKGKSLTIYSGSDDPDKVAWYRDNSGGRTKAGAGKAPNDIGIYDMSGNVSEWCWDWYDAKYPSILTTFVNPKGPDKGSFKVVRGGNITNGEGVGLRLLTREKGNPDRGYPSVGFRLVRKGSRSDRG